MKFGYQKIVQHKLYYFFSAIALLSIFAIFYTSTPSINLTSEQLRIIGQKIWQNEGAGKKENLIIWNKHEAFPSLGVGHFIWFPKNVDPPFNESFPALLKFIAKKQSLPKWLSELNHAPWQNRDAFIEDFNDNRMKKLRSFLENTISLQVEFIALRMENALPEMLATLSNPSQKERIKMLFYRIANQTNGMYALIDYINFKGEGTSKKEQYKNQGWGLLQVLEQMNADPKDVMQEFVRSANIILTKRVKNASRDESHWLPGWRKRLNTYLVN